LPGQDSDLLEQRTFARHPWSATPDSFEMKGTFSVEDSGPSWAHPVVIGGRLYLLYDTHLPCFDVKAKWRAAGFTAGCRAA